jgi:hypothetical protein
MASLTPKFGMAICSGNVENLVMWKTLASEV